MNRTKAIKSSSIHIEEAENLYIDQLETAPGTHIYMRKVKHLRIDKIKLATAAHLHIEKAEHLHIDQIELATTDTSYNGQSNNPRETSTRPPLTNSQLVLGSYYILESLGVTHRSVDMADVARFMHFLTGKSYTQISNSEFYKKLKRAPNFKKDPGLIKDLTVLNSTLEELGLKKVTLIINQELLRARREIKHSS